MDKKNSSRFVVVFMAALILVSVGLVWIMIQNYSKDTSKERSALTRAHKEAKEEAFAYSPERGQQVYNQFCLRCHGAQGQGTMSAPPLAGSKIVSGDKSSLVKVAVHGMKGKIERNGKVYDLVMPGFPMITHEDLAHVLNYVRNSFGNEAEEVTKVEVIEVKVETVGRKGPWTEEELK